MYKHTHSLVACARWENEDIVEWIEYHLALGFDHFYIYSNDDDPHALFKILLPYITGSEPRVTFSHWSTLGAQADMYADFLRRHKSETRWAMFLDIDEFVTLKKSDTIGRFLSSFRRNVDCIYFNWLVYGNNHKIKRDNKSILATLTRRSRCIDVHTKTIWRTAKVTAELAREGAQRTANPYTHFWNGYRFGSFVMRDVLNRSVDDYADNFPEAAYRATSDPRVSESMIETAYVAHFVIKSEDDFLRRAARGGFAAQTIWKERYERGEHTAFLEQFNAIEDNYLAVKWQRIIANRIHFGSND